MKPFDPRLLRYSRRSRGFILTLVFIASLGAVLTITQAFFIVDLVCKFFQQKRSFDSLRAEIIELAIVFLGRALLAYSNDRVSSRASSKIRGELRSRIMAKTLANSGSDSQELGTAGLAVLVTKGINNLDAYFSKYLPQLFIAVVVPVAVGVTIAYRDWKSGIIILFTIPLIPIFGILVGRFTAAATAKKWQTLSLLSGYFLDLLSGITTLRVYGREKLQSNKLREVGERFRNETMQVLRISFLSSLALELIATLSVALLAVTIGLRLVNGSMPLSVGLFVLVLAPEVYWPIRQVSAYFHAAADGVAAFQRLFSILEKPNPSGADPISGVSRIAWSRLVVNYSGQTKVVIPPGDLNMAEVHAFIGPSGVGKSTLAAILLGFISPSEGEVVITFNGKDSALSDLEMSTWRKLIAWQPQEPKFPLGSVTDILRHADPSANDEKLMRILRTVDLDPADLPDGLSTMLGTMRQKLSIGQLRKIALARALLKEAPFIILDEPTASIDDISEARIVDLLGEQAKRGAIILVISHREMLISASSKVTRIEAQI